jgi:hypothetical protein
MPRALFPWQDEICHGACAKTVVQFVLRLWKLVRKHANSTSDANFSGTSKLQCADVFPGGGQHMHSSVSDNTTTATIAIAELKEVDELRIRTHGLCLINGINKSH